MGLSKALRKSKAEAREGADEMLACATTRDALASHGDVPQDDLCGLRSREALLAFSRARQNAFCWYELPSNARVLELRCGCGGATGYFAQHASRVLCVEEDAQQAQVCACQHAHATVVEVLNASLQDALDGLDELFDLVVLHDLRLGDEQLMQLAAQRLADGGTLMLTASNALGTTELASARMEQTGPINLETEGDKDPGTLLLRSQIEDMLASAGLTAVDVYYPHPDHRFARYVFSDDRLPDEGELTYFEDSTGVSRVRTLHEERLQRAFLAQGSFCLVANSFLFLARKAAGQQPTKSQEPMHASPVVYAKVSSERDARFAIVTTVEQGHVVHKRALLPQGKGHVEAILDAQEQLQQLFEQDGLFKVNRAWREGEGLRLEYLMGQTLEDKVAIALGDNDLDVATGLLTEYRNRVLVKAKASFAATDGFAAVFGRCLDKSSLDLLAGMPCLQVTDVDLILRNVVPQQDAWHLIDYEWTFAFPVPAHFVLWRSLHYLMLTSEIARKALDRLGCWELFGLDEHTRAIFLAMEDSFQDYVTGGTVPVDSVLRDCDPRPHELPIVWNEARCWRDDSFVGRLRHAKHVLM